MSLFSFCQTPSQQGGMLDNDQEGVSGNNQWVPYSLGRRDVPPDNLVKKVNTQWPAKLLVSDVKFLATKFQ